MMMTIPTNNTHANPLANDILPLLLDSKVWKVHELAARLIELNALPSLCSGELSELAQRNFLIMNALFQLQEDFLTDGCYLSISSLHIQLIYDYSPSFPRCDDALKSYYLNWQNYNLSNDEVAQLLSQFTSLFKNKKLTQDQLEALNLRWQLEAPIHISNVKKRWRVLANQYHPDKSAGDHTVFNDIHTEYQRLLSHCRSLEV
ncbi:DNA-J related domain-containing protein [Pseudoalteromonas sp. GB56]